MGGRRSVGGHWSVSERAERWREGEARAEPRIFVRGAKLRRNYRVFWWTTLFVYYSTKKLPLI